MALMTDKLAHLSTKFLFQFFNNKDLDVFLTNLDDLPCKCDYSLLIGGHHKHIVIVDLQRLAIML